MKVWLFYLKKDGCLYAYATEKSLAEGFRDTRNMKRFIEKKENMDKILFSAFMATHTKERLVENPLDMNDGTFVTLPTTVEEDFQLTQQVEEIEEKVRLVVAKLDRIGLKKEYDEACRELINIYPFPTELHINTFLLFVEANKYTLNWR